MSNWRAPRVLHGGRAWCAPCVNTVLGRWSWRWLPLPCQNDCLTSITRCLPVLSVLPGAPDVCAIFYQPPSACYFCCTSFFIDSNIGTIPTRATTWPVIFVPFSLQFMHTRGQPDPPRRGRGGSNYIVQIHARPALFWSLPVNTPNGSY